MLRCVDGSLYTGIAKDVQARLALHQSGRGAVYTRGRGPLKLVYKKNKLTCSQALKQEHALKRLKKQEKEKLLKWRSSRLVKSKTIQSLSIKNGYRLKKEQNVFLIQLFYVI